jgi:hypothetical protein
MVLMAWLVTIHNVRTLVANRRTFGLVLEAALGAVLAVGVGITLYYRTRDLSVSPAPGSALCVPIDESLQRVLFYPAAFLALASSAALKLQALRAAIAKRASDLLDALMNSIMLETGLLVFVVLEISLVWFLFAQCDSKFGAPKVVAAHFANASGIGMCLIVAVPSAATFMLVRSLPAGDERAAKWTRKALGSMLGSLAPVLVGALVQSWLA